MKALLPFLLPFAALFLMLTGVYRLWRPEYYVRKAELKAKKQGTNPAPGKAPPPPPNPREVRWHGVFNLVAGGVIMIFSGSHFGWVPSRSISASAPGTLETVVSREAQSFFRDQHLVNLAVGAVADDDEIIISLGKQSLLGLESVGGDTLYEIGSITKTFTGILLAKMIEEGTVKLDDPVVDFLPTAKDFPKDITFRHLATHTSGLERMPANYFNFRRVALMLFGRDPYRDYSEEEFLAALRNPKLEYATGSESRYSNFGVSLLGYVLASQEGGTYEEILRQKVLAPLGMNDTSITLSREQKGRLAQGYRATVRLGPLLLGRTSSTWDLPNPLAGAGALRSTPRDMMKYLKANLGRNTNSLSSALTRAQQQLHAGDRMQTGMNWIRRPGKNDKPTIIWHNGGTGGYHSFIGFTEDKRFGVFVLSGTGQSVDALGAKLLNALQDELVDSKSSLAHEATALSGTAANLASDP